jgi:hypothetical protein
MKRFGYANLRIFTGIVAVVVACSASVAAEDAKTYLVHRNWFYLSGQATPGSLIFRKYLPVAGGYKNITNLHCPQNQNDDMYVTMDLTSVPETSKAITELRDHSYQLGFKQGEKTYIHIPFSMEQATYQVWRKGTTSGFDTILGGGQEFNFVLFGESKALMEVLFDDELEEKIRIALNQGDMRKALHIRRAELYSTVDVVSSCARFRGRSR